MMSNPPPPSRAVSAIPNFMPILMILVATSAQAGERPWPGDRWRADVSEIRQGHLLRTTLLGTETHTERGSRVTVVCTDLGENGAERKVVRGSTFALMRQDDFEGGTAVTGEFSIHFPGSSLVWLDPSPCAGGRITWRKRP